MVQKIGKTAFRNLGFYLRAGGKNMKKRAVIYVSVHHGNTKKLISCAFKTLPIDMLTVAEAEKCNLFQYDCIGVTSIRWGNFTLLFFAF